MRERRQLDARALAKLLAQGDLEAVWMPDERCRILRRRLARREHLVRARTRAKSQIHPSLQRRLIEKPKVSDLFGLAGRAWLAEVELPTEERESVDAGLRRMRFLDGEIAAVEKLIAKQALSWPEIQRLMTVPGVNYLSAAGFLAATGHPDRFLDARKLVAYLGLDPASGSPGRAGTLRPDLQARVRARPLDTRRGGLGRSAAPRRVEGVL